MQFGTEAKLLVSKGDTTPIKHIPFNIPLLATTDLLSICVDVPALYLSYWWNCTTYVWLVPGFFHVAWCFQGLSILPHTIHSFLWVNALLLQRQTTFCISIHPWTTERLPPFGSNFAATTKPSGASPAQTVFSSGPPGPSAALQTVLHHHDHVCSLHKAPGFQGVRPHLPSPHTYSCTGGHAHTCTSRERLIPRRGGGWCLSHQAHIP